MKLTILDLVPRFQGESIKDAIDRTMKLAKYADERGFDRYWTAEHHNSKAIVGGASEVIVGHLLEHTENIEIGPGGVMLPNHTVFQVAERYGTLEALFPGRISIGIGRAPGTDFETAKLIYRDIYRQDNFKQAVKDLLSYFDGEENSVSPYPGTGAHIPVHILSSSTSGAKVASELGLPYSFAGHFSPNKIKESIDLYRENFEPSKYLDKPYVSLAAFTYVADTKEEAELLDSHGKQIFLQLAGRDNEEFFELSPDFETGLTSIEKFMIRANRGLTISGDRKAAEEKYNEIMERYNPDELIVGTYIKDYDKLRNNFDIIYDIVKG